MKLALLVLVGVIAVSCGAWGYTYELAYFTALKLDVSETLRFEHYVVSAASNVFPMLAIAVVLALMVKFFSKEVTRDDMKAFKESLVKRTFADEVATARVGVLVSLVFLLLVVFDVRLGRETDLGYMFWLVTFFNMQCFAGSVYLSPSHSRPAVWIAFVASVAMCFAAGGLSAGRNASKASADLLRDDYVVQIRRDGTTVLATAKDLNLPASLLDRVFRLFGAPKVGAPSSSKP